MELQKLKGGLQIGLVLIAVSCLTGCASLVGSSSVQSFYESTPVFDENGNIVTDKNGYPVLTIKEGKTKTVALPFGTNALAGIASQLRPLIDTLQIMSEENE